MEILGTLILPLILAFANAAGIGGGGIVVPFCILFYKFETKRAIALSGFSIFIASVTRYLYNWNARHPGKD